MGIDSSNNNTNYYYDYALVRFDQNGNAESATLLVDQMNAKLRDYVVDLSIVDKCDMTIQFLDWNSSVCDSVPTG